MSSSTPLTLSYARPRKRWGRRQSRRPDDSCARSTSGAAPRCWTRARSSMRPPGSTSPCSSRAKPAQAKSSSRVRSTSSPRGAPGRSSRSTARPCHGSSWRASCSGTSAAPSRAPTSSRSANSAAHRGTIFLDEIGDLHPALQAKLLHVLQDGEFSRIGAKSTLSVDVRVLAATNQHLERAVAESRFREDLYYRLNVINVFVPPLRERAAEIPLLANYFVERYAKLYRRDGFVMAPAVVERLTRHPFPGNVRELENLIKRMIVLDDPFLTRIPLPDAVAGGGRLPSASPPPPEPSLKEIARRASRAAEREAISMMLERTGWNRVRAARALRISYRALLYKIKEAGLDSERLSARSAL